MSKRWLMALTLVLGACAGSSASNGEQVAAAVERWWHERERLSPGDEFSADERACIAERAESVNLRDVVSAADGAFDERTGAYLAPYADECITDEHLKEYLRVDFIFSGTPPVEAACRAPWIVEIIREHGFAEVWARNRSDPVRADYEELNEYCG